MKGVILGGLIVAIIVVAVIVAVDVAGTPKPAASTCTLATRILLPDICASGCPKCPECPTASTRPYAVFWTQAASCPGFCLCP